jgi:hypothetical protein
MKPMTLRDVLDLELTSLEFNPNTMGIMTELVEDICVAVLFKNGHSHIITPNIPDARKRILKDINHFMGEKNV